MFSEVRHRMPVELTALEIHSRISSSRVLSQYRFENNQRLQQFLPWSFGHLAHAAHQIADIARLLRHLQHFPATDDELLQHYQLQSRNEQRELAHVESGDG